MRINDKPCFLCILLLLLSFTVNAQNQNDAYDFPVKLGSAEWGLLLGDGFDRRLEVCQVPKTILNKMSNEGLIVTCLNYPLNHEIIAHSCPQSGFSAIMWQSNAYQELKNRKGIAELMIIKFTEFNPYQLEKIPVEPPITVIDTTITENYRKVLKFYKEYRSTTMLMAQDFIIDSLELPERKELVKICCEKLIHMSKYPNIYGGLTMGYYAFIMIKGMNSANYLPLINKIKEDIRFSMFLDCGMLPLGIFDDLIAMSNSFVSELK